MITYFLLFDDLHTEVHIPRKNFDEKRWSAIRTHLIMIWYSALPQELIRLSRPPDLLNKFAVNTNHVQIINSELLHRHFIEKTQNTELKISAMSNCHFLFALASRNSSLSRIASTDLSSTEGAPITTSPPNSNTTAHFLLISEKRSFVKFIYL